LVRFAILAATTCHWSEQYSIRACRVFRAPIAAMGQGNTVIEGAVACISHVLCKRSRQLLGCRNCTDGYVGLAEREDILSGKINDVNPCLQKTTVCKTLQYPEAVSFIEFFDVKYSDIKTTAPTILSSNKSLILRGLSLLILTLTCVMVPSNRFTSSG
jgi:hypothetical protein